MRRIGFIGFEGLTGLDLTGPAEVFGQANILQPGAYEILILAEEAKPFASDAGLQFLPHSTFAQAPSLDTIIVPGGAGLRAAIRVDPIVAWLKIRADTRRLACVCTGIYALAAAGLLDGRRATTHWRFAADFARQYPKVRVESESIYLGDGNVFSSAGVTAGIDLALSFVEDDLGPSLALAVARELVVYLKRPGGQMQYSAPLKFQARAKNRFADIAAWIATNLQADLSVETLASRAGLGVRHFSRKFTEVFGSAPAAYVEQLRLDESRSRLGAPNQTVDSVAASVGYASADSYRRAFERRFGVTPSLYRGCFSTMGGDNAARATASD
jgi:transcriptional regulator GlxA family with amidase domain